MVARGIIPPANSRPMYLGEAMDLIASIKNLCVIAQMIYPRAPRSVMYTLIEVIVLDAQALLRFCSDDKMED